MLLRLFIILFGITASGFCRDQLFPVAKNGKWGLVSQNGDVILSPVYDYLEYNQSGKKFIYYHQGKMGLIDLQGNILSDPIHEQIAFLDTNWISYSQGGKWNLCYGSELVMDHRFDSTVMQSNQLIKLVQADTMLLFNPQTRAHSTQWYANTFLFNGLLLAGRTNLYYEILNQADFRPMVTKFISCKLAGKNYLVINFSDGKTIYTLDQTTPVSERFDAIEYLSEDFFVCEKSGAKKLFQADKKLFFSLPDFDEISKISGSYLFFQKNGLTGIWNYKKGQLICAPKYDAVSSDGSSFFVRLNGFYGIVTMDGSELIPPIYSSISAYDNVFLVSQNELFGLISSGGKKIKNCVYSEIRIYANNVKCFRDKKLDLLNLDANGNLLAETNYTDYMTISFDQEKLPRQRSQDLTFTGNSLESVRSEWEAYGWFQKTSERIVKDSVQIIKGNWGLMYDMDSIAIQPRFPDIRVIKSVGVTQCYMQKVLNPELKEDLQKLHSAKAFFSMSEKLKGYSEGFFRLADHRAKRLLDKIFFQYIEYNDFKKYKLARAVTKNLVLCDSLGNIAYDSLTYYGFYDEQILPVCFGGKYAFSKKAGGFNLESTINFFNRIGMHFRLADANAQYFSVTGGKWYFINAAGKKLNDEPFEFVRPFKRNRAIVMRKGLWGVVDSSMVEIVPIKYHSVEEFFVNGQQFFKVRNSVSNTYIYERSSGVVTKSDIVHTKYYSEGRWFAQLRNGSHALVDTLLNPLTPFSYQVVSPFEDGYAMVTTRGKRSVIDHSGNEYLQGYKAKDINYLGYGRFEVVQSKGSLIVTIKQDTLLLPVTCKSVVECNEKYIVYKDPGQNLKLYTTDTQQKLPKDVKIISWCLEDETLLLRKDDKTRIFSLKEGKYITKPLTNVSAIGPACYIYKNTEQKKGLVRLNGDTVIHALYEDIEIQPNHWAVARVDKRTLIRIDLNGKPLDDQTFSRYFRKKDHYIFYGENGIGLFDLNGQMILPCEFDHIEKYNSNFYKTTADDEHDLYYLDGQRVIPNRYADYKGFSTGTMVVKSGGFDYLYTGYLNKSLSFQSVDPINSDLFILTEINHQGVYNSAGETIIPVRYHNIVVDRGYLQVRFFNSFGYYSTEGLALFESYQ